MAFHHIPVLFDEVMTWLDPQPGGVYCDGTLGGGGHSEGILTRAGEGTALYGIDRDERAIAAASARLAGFPGFRTLRGNFHDAKALLAAEGVEALDGALLDLGVSSPQLDEAERGFSYHEEAPLDMRMDTAAGPTAADLLNTLPEAEIARILRDYAEEKWAARIAKLICERRAKQPLATTGDLVACVDAAIPKAVRRKDDGHPARRTFQAVRIAVNDELAPLAQAGGREPHDLARWLRNRRWEDATYGTDWENELSRAKERARQAGDVPPSPEEVAAKKRVEEIRRSLKARGMS